MLFRRPLNYQQNQQPTATTVQQAGMKAWKSSPCKRRWTEETHECLMFNLCFAIDLGGRSILWELALNSITQWHVILQMMLLQWKSSQFSVLYLAWGLNPYAWRQTSCALWCLCVSSIGAYWLIIVSYKLLQKLCAPCHHALVLTFNSFFKTWSTSGRAYYNKTEFRYKFQDVVCTQKTWYQTIGIISCVQSGILVYYMIATSSGISWSKYFGRTMCCLH